MIMDKKSFTLIELMVTIVIISIIASFALVNYNRAVERSRGQDAKNQLGSIHAANGIYFAKKNIYWPEDSTTYDLDSINGINQSLGLAIIANDMTYSCTGTDGTTFSCVAKRIVSGAETFRVTVTEAALDPAANPVCSGACP